MSPQIDHIVLCVRDIDEAASAYENLGFMVTPRASHPWGTANRLVQFSDRNFIEILEVADRKKIFPHDLSADPMRFSFGAFNRAFLEQGEGMSMIVLAGEDAAADVARFKAVGLDSYEPFSFERIADLPGGKQVKVGFELAFASHKSMPRAAFFTCHNLFPENFWKAAYQHHKNGAAGITEAVLVAPDPAGLGEFLQGFCGASVQTIAGGIMVPCNAHKLAVVSPVVFEAHFNVAAPDMGEGPRFGAITIEGAFKSSSICRADLPGGLVLELRRRDG